MMSFLSTLGWGFAALLAVAVAVAAWEHLRTKSQNIRAIPPQVPRRAVSLDVNLDRLPDAPDVPALPTGDQARRAAALDSALGRMSTPPSAQQPSGQAWTETQPMVAASLQVELPAERGTAHPAGTPRA